ncbi:MAG: ATP-binding cassette domain-containing protein [Candidatus Marinimicrobia bacterium]|nr:ATP-binding cassette domain-containing protein [Candidatus Neomarinimicrobiota bacterium]
MEELSGMVKAAAIRRGKNLSVLNSMSVKIEKLNYRYDNDGEFQLKIDELTHEFNGPLGLYGLSGSGKTTFSRLMAGVISPVSGNIKFETESRKRHPKIVYSPQFPENILLGIRIEDMIQRIVMESGRTDLYGSIRNYLGKFSLDYNVIKGKNGYELSGGELRRLAIALSLSLSPDLLILDEPTIGLGFQGKQQLFTILEEIRKSSHVMIVSHDFRLIRKICRNFWILHCGRLIFNGDWEALRKNEKIRKVVGIDILSHFLTQYFESKEQIDR